MKDPLLLNIETATEICSVCLSRGENVLAVREEPEAYKHAELITLFIEDCLEEAEVRWDEVDGVSVSLGPGSYTGLRIGLSVAKGICFGKDIPLIGISSLESLAFALLKKAKGQAELVIPMIDARRMEVYAGIYDRSLNVVIEPYAVVLDDNVFTAYYNKGKIWVGGNGSDKFMGLINTQNVVFEKVACSSLHLAPLANKYYHQQKWDDIAYLNPFYLKPPNITKPRSGSL